MDFLEEQEAFCEYIRNHLGTYLNNIDVPPVINDVIDLQKHHEDALIFVSFEDYNYESLSLDSQLKTFNVSLCPIVTMDTSDNLHIKIWALTQAIKDLFSKNSTMDGLVDLALLTQILSYEYAGGDSSMKATVINIKVETEDLS